MGGEPLGVGQEKKKGPFRRGGSRFLRGGVPKASVNKGTGRRTARGLMCGGKGRSKASSERGTLNV